MATTAVSTSPTPLRAAFEARDHDGVVRALAPDVVLNSPIFDVPFEGRGTGAVLRALGAPPSLMMRAVARLGPRMLALNRSSNST